MYAQDSIDLLTRSGIDFEKNEKRGIDVQHFGELLMVSGLVLCDNIKWISFHSGYDFGYLLKLLTCTPLPAEEAAFFELLHTYFPGIYDEKYMMRDCGDGIKGGLNYLAEQIQVRQPFLASACHHVAVVGRRLPLLGSLGSVANA